MNQNLKHAAIVYHFRATGFDQGLFTEVVVIFLSDFIAIGALLVSLYTLLVRVFYNRRTLMPLPDFSLEVGDESLVLRLLNEGAGATKAGEACLF